MLNFFPATQRGKIDACLYAGFCFIVSILALENIVPDYLRKIGRRRFLAGVLAAGGSFLLPRRLPAKEATIDENYWVLLADTHVGADLEQERHNVKPARRLEAVVKALSALQPQPAGVIFAGDCAFLQGEAEDYALLSRLVYPLREAGMSLHFALGNHDHRERFLAAFPTAQAAAAVPPGAFSKLVSVVETPYADWFLLDSLDQVNVTSGCLGEEQLAWLAEALDARKDKPALVLAHHHPDWEGKSNGLKDTAALFDVLSPRRRVKAYFYGHTHRWSIGRYKDVHLVNLPTTAWLFDPIQPNGFVTIYLRPEGASLTLHPLDGKPPTDGQKVELRWRA